MTALTAERVRGFLEMLEDDGILVEVTCTYGPKFLEDWEEDKDCYKILLESDVGMVIECQTDYSWILVLKTDDGDEYLEEFLDRAFEVQLASGQWEGLSDAIYRKAPNSEEILEGL